MKYSFLFLLILTTLQVSSQPSEPAPLDKLPLPLDQLAQFSIKHLTVYYNNYAEGGKIADKGLRIAHFTWKPGTLIKPPRILSAVGLSLEGNQIFGKDSLSWDYAPGQVTQYQHDLTFADPDYRDYASFIDFGQLEDVEMPEFISVLEPEQTVSLFTSGRLHKAYTAYDTTYYTYDAQRRLVHQKILDPERQSMDMTGQSEEEYEYDEQGKHVLTRIIQYLPNGDRDTLIHQYVYNEQGQMIHHQAPGFLSNGNSITFTYDENGHLIREEKHRKTFRSSGPPDYTRQEIDLHFLTEYRYKNGLLVEKRLLRNGELEPDGWIKYEYQSTGLLSKKILMNVFEKTPYEAYTYEYELSP